MDKTKLQNLVIKLLEDDTLKIDFLNYLKLLSLQVSEASDMVKLERIFGDQDIAGFLGYLQKKIPDLEQKIVHYLENHSR